MYSYKDIFPVLRCEILIRRFGYISEEQARSATHLLNPLSADFAPLTDSLVERILLSAEHHRKQATRVVILARM